MDALAWLTAGLLVVTGYYAVTTHLTLQELRKQREADREMWSRDKSEAAVLACFEQVRDVVQKITEDGPAILGSTAAGLWASLRAHGPLIRDQATRDKVAATAEVMFVTSFEQGLMDKEGLSRPVVNGAAAGMLRRLTFVLERYLRDEDPQVSDWNGLPDAASAASWIRKEGADWRT